MVEMECGAAVGVAFGSPAVVVVVGGVDVAAVGGDGSMRLINTDGTTDLRPNIGSNRSRMESRGLILLAVLPLDNKKSKSFGFKITARKKNK